MEGGTWKAAGHGVAKSQTRLSDFTFTFHFHALEKEMATHSSVLAWRIPGTGQPGGLPSLGSHRVGHNWSDLADLAAVVILHYYLNSLMTYAVEHLFTCLSSAYVLWWGFVCVFWLHQAVCGISVPWPGIEPRPLAVKVWSSNHWSWLIF